MEPAFFEDAEDHEGPAETPGFEPIMTVVHQWLQRSLDDRAFGT
jgi:hypothetical protein